MTTVRMGRVLNGFNVSHVEGVQLEKVHTFLLSSHLFHRPVPGCPYLNYHSTLLTSLLKGTVSRDFLLLVFFMNQYPPSPRVSNFLENLLRYSQVKVHHRYQQHQWQIFPPFSLTLLIPVANLPPVSTIPAASLPLVSTASVANNGNNYQTADNLK
jgi:hypothetical protein